MRTKATRTHKTAVWFEKVRHVCERTGIERIGTVTDCALDNASIVLDTLAGEYGVSVFGQARGCTFCATVISPDPYAALADVSAFLMTNFKVVHWNDAV